MRKLTKASLSELAESKEIISFLEQKSYVGGGSGTTTDPYTQNEFETIVGNGNWTGGYVLGLEEKKWRALIYRRNRFNTWLYRVL